jgi:hypothetical protein
VKVSLACLMALNASVFFFGAALHMGFLFGPFRQPRIFTAAIVEILCGLSLCWGTTAVFRGHSFAGRAALTANLVALAGILLGVLAPALRHQTWPVIALDHRIMLALIAVSLLSLPFTRLEPSSRWTTNQRM